jgi:hypothetical protein
MDNTGSTTEAAPGREKWLHGRFWNTSVQRFIENFREFWYFRGFNDVGRYLGMAKRNTGFRDHRQGDPWRGDKLGSSNPSGDERAWPKCRQPRGRMSKEGIIQWQIRIAHVCAWFYCKFRIHFGCRLRGTQIRQTPWEGGGQACLTRSWDAVATVLRMN